MKGFRLSIAQHLLPIRVVFYHLLRLAPRCPASTLVLVHAGDSHALPPPSAIKMTSSCALAKVYLLVSLVPRPFLYGWGERGKGLVNNSTPTQIHGCIPAVSVDEENANVKRCES